MKLWRVLGVCAAAALTAYFIWFAVRHLDARAIDALADGGVLFAVLVAALLYGLVIPVSAWAWRALLLGQNVHRAWSELATIMAVTQLAKYVPGNVAQFAGRIVVAVRAGLPARVVASSIVHEQVLAVAASLVVGLAALYLAGSSSSIDPMVQTSWLVILAVLLAGLAVFLAAKRMDPERLRRLLGFLGGMPGPMAAIRAFAAYVFNYLLVGLGLWLIAIQMGLGEYIGFAMATSVFALSWALGFLTPGAPAGLGVREGIMVVLLAGSAAPETQILIFILVVRVATVLGDAACFGVGWGSSMWRGGSWKAGDHGQ